MVPSGETVGITPCAVAYKKPTVLAGVTVGEAGDDDALAVHATSTVTTTADMEQRFIGASRDVRHEPLRAMDVLSADNA
jgi:hypothetical protein